MVLTSESQIRNRINVALLLLVLLLAGCSGSSTDTDPAIGITIIPDPLVVVGKTKQMSAHLMAVSGANKGPTTVTWTSDDPSIATVNDSGILSGIKIGVANLSAKNESFSATAAISVVAPSPGAKNLTVAGKAFYEDKPYTANGFTGQTVNTAVRKSIINLIAVDGGVTLGSTSTGEDGSYSFNNIDNSSRQAGVYLQLFAKTTASSTSPAEVQNNSLNKILLAAIGDSLDDSLNNNFPSQNIIVPATGIGGAFNILDQFLKGGALIQQSGFCPTQPNLICTAPFLRAFWEYQSNTGSAFDTAGMPTIFIGGGGPTKDDPDEYDDTIIAHEYGHFIASNFSHDNSPGGSHIIGDLNQDIRLSWSEGWATFYGSAVLGSPLYIDTVKSGKPFTYNIESATQPYTTNEVSVSAVLWDMLDAPTPLDDDPMTTTGLFPVWESFTKIPVNVDATMETFAFEFMNRNAGSLSNFQTILTGRQIELFPDSMESNGETNLVVNGPLQHHTLYLSGANPVGDEDVVPFNVNNGQTYTLKTFNLTNGADTFITLKDGSTVLFTNDNTGTSAASSITFTATTSGTFSAFIKRSSTAPPSAGLTGSYDVKLTSP